MTRISGAALVLLVSAGCGWVTSEPAPSELASETPYRPIANVRQTMERILDPAADVIWDSAGFVITAQGEDDLSPTTAAGWEQVLNSATLVAEAGNLLLLPGRVGGPDWVRYAQGLTAAGEAAMAAAEAHDADALFDAGGEIYLACRACHEQYLVSAQPAEPLP